MPADPLLQVAFFSLDTNEALKARPDLAFKYQTALDELLSGLFDVCVSHFEGILHTTAALSKPTNGLTILEQSYLHAEYPARLPIVAKGIESIRQLQFALVETAQKAIAPAAFEDLDAVSRSPMVASNRVNRLMGMRPDCCTP